MIIFFPSKFIQILNQNPPNPNTETPKAQKTKQTTSKKKKEKNNKKTTVTKEILTLTLKTEKQRVTLNFKPRYRTKDIKTYKDNTMIYSEDLK